MKILITGILGYIGTELTKVYANTEHEIIGIDNRFLPERLNYLTSHAKNIKFYQRDLFNLKDLITSDIDVCIHLAGITDVAYTNTQSNPAQDALIRKVGVDGTIELLNLLPKKCKIVFPSTHVVFEGFEKEQFDVNESCIPCPILAYSQTKVQNETDIINSGLDYTILRLASVYGYNENMRVGIVGNLFSKMASQNQNIKLFGGGFNFKPCVGVKDVARCMKFFSESNYKGIYHLVNENYTVKQIAEICKSYNPSISLQETPDEIPNKGYTLSNEKLLDTGFIFTQSLKHEIGDMIFRWKTN